MKHYKFLYEYHQDFGYYGWRWDKRPDFDPATGIGVAHDIMEHLPNDDRSLWGEVEAVGASVYLRGLNGFFHRRSSYIPVHEHIGSGLMEVAEHYTGRRSSYPQSLTVPEKYKHLLDKPPKLRCEFAEELICDSINHVEKEATLEWDLSIEDDSLDLDYQKDMVNAIKYIQKVAQVGVRTGYMKARKRYGDLDTYTLAYAVFGKIAEEADKLLKKVEPEDNMDLIVKPIFNKYFVECELVEAT
jgi:hypothetical protein